MKNKIIYQPNIKKLKEILGHIQIYSVLTQEKLDLVKKTVELMGGQLKEKRKKRKVRVNEEEKSQIKQILNLLLRIVIEQPLTPILKDLVNEFIILASAWNEEVGRQIEIRETIFAIRRFIDYHLSVIDTIRILKIFQKRMEQIQKFSPPAFELSRHYLKALEKLEEEEKKKKSNKKPSGSKN